MPAMALVNVTREGDTALVAFARPPLNAFNLELIEELDESLQRLAVEPPPGGLVLTGEGAVFSAGVDFKETPSYSDDQRARLVRTLNSAVTELYGFPTATVAAVNGHAIGGALVMMLACDARLAAAATQAKLGLTEVTAGLPYPAAPIAVVGAEIEPSYRRHLVLSGERIDPATALERGLVDELVAPPQLIARAVELARSRAAASAYPLVKEQLRAQTLARMRHVVASGTDPLLER
jgi:enoyl-CoA hydratase/carnithine racemase